MARPLIYRLCQRVAGRRRAGFAPVRGQRHVVSIGRGFWFAPEIASYHRGCTDTRPTVTIRHDYPSEEGMHPLTSARRRPEPGIMIRRSRRSSSWRDQRAPSVRSPARASAPNRAFPTTEDRAGSGSAMHHRPSATFVRTRLPAGNTGQNVASDTRRCATRNRMPAIWRWRGCNPRAGCRTSSPRTSTGCIRKPAAIPSARSSSMARRTGCAVSTVARHGRRTRSRPGSSSSHCPAVRRAAECSAPPRSSSVRPCRRTRCAARSLSPLDRPDAGRRQLAGRPARRACARDRGRQRSAAWPSSTTNQHPWTAWLTSSCARVRALSSARSRTLCSTADEAQGAAASSGWQTGQ